MLTENKRIEDDAVNKKAIQDKQTQMTSVLKICIAPDPS
jgi:hypothetical protein